MQLYDMHSHILPGFDDGAKTVEDSLALIDCLKKQGVSNICLTPHFYTHEMAPSDYIAKRNAVFESFLPHIPADVSIILGSEVYVTQFLFNGDDLSGLAYGKSGYILTEFPYSCDFGDKTMNMMDSLWSNHKLTPVLPHVERYEYLIDHPDEYQQLCGQSSLFPQAQAAQIYSERADRHSRLGRAFLYAQHARKIHTGDEHDFAEMR